MTLAYKIFGIPKTFDEFVDKVRRRGEKQVDIVLEAHNSLGSGFGPYVFNYHCNVILRSGKNQLKLGSHTHVRKGNLLQSVIGKAEVELAGLKETVEIAENLQNRFLEARISGRSVHEAKEEIAKYNDRINDARRKYASHL